MKLDYLGGTEFLINQGDEFYRMNSDTELLGRFLRMKHQHRFLEIGRSFSTYQTPSSLS